MLRRCLRDDIRIVCIGFSLLCFLYGEDIYMEKDLISVVVPVYNVEKYLPECIESILGQTYQKFELILIDDGSTDSSPGI